MLNNYSLKYVPFKPQSMCLRLTHTSKINVQKCFQILGVAFVIKFVPFFFFYCRSHDKQLHSVIFNYLVNNIYIYIL